MKKIKFNIPFSNNKNLADLTKLNVSKEFSGNMTFSKKCEKFLKKKFNFKEVLLTDSCSSSFEIIAQTLEKYKKKDVLLSSYNYPTVASAFIKRGFNIKFLDRQRIALNKK